MSEKEIILLVLLAIIGACFGSFITAASWRLPRNEDAVAGASKCPKCRTRLKFLDLFPIFSWLFSGGKCRYCKAKISPRYIMTEIVTAALCVGLYFKFGLTWEFLIIGLLAVALLILIISDFETYIMPDSTTIAAFILAIAYHYVRCDEWGRYLIGFAACLVVALGLRYGFYLITKREGLGMGDVKFLPVAGLWVGFAAIPVYFIIAGVVGVITGVVWKIIFKNPEYPFGPALAIAMFLLVLFPEINFILTSLPN